MTSIFISHASRDDDIATQLGVWLDSAGFSDVFIDHSSISGGEAWADALRANAGSCRVVLCLVTPNWLGSGECTAEFKAAWYMGKRIIPLFLLGDEDNLAAQQRDQLSRVRAEAQGIDLSPFLSDGSLEFSKDESRADTLKKGLRACGALSDVGLDPASFETDPALRPSPFPGLTSFGDEDADAALFFGRSREIAEILEWLRELRATNRKEPLVILGASGAGKSSLIKAGVIPRLRRESPAWLPLRAFRPGADPLLNFASAMTRTSADFDSRRSHGQLKEHLLNEWRNAKTILVDGQEKSRPESMNSEGNEEETFFRKLVDVLEAEGQNLRTLANRPNATILVSIDQAEEIVRSEGESGAALSDYLRAATLARSSWRLIFTIRTDSFTELQSHARFNDLKMLGYDLRSMPIFRFDDVVEHPARRYGVKVEPDTTDALIEASPGKDALPLLAFALQRLWDQFSETKSLRLKDYESMGGVAGLIEDAAERALRGIDPEQFDTSVSSQRVNDKEAVLCASVFLPALVDLNDEGSVIRRVADWENFEEEEQELLDRFIRWRLVVRKESERRGGTVEVAHEALFREWRRLKEWLEPERKRLGSLRNVKLATAIWANNDCRGEFLTHFDERLAAAKELLTLPRYQTQLGKLEKKYLEAAKVAEQSKRRQRRKQQIQIGGSVGAAVLFVASIAWLNRLPISQFLTVQWNYAIYSNSVSDLQDLQPGEPFRDCALDSPNCPTMIVLPAGSFTMGSLADDISEPDELPQQEIEIARLAVSKYEITVSEYQVCVRAGYCSVSVSEDERKRNGLKPMGNLSWEDAVSYADWLSEMTGENYRLLSEAEWEYAARSGTDTTYSYGDEITTKQANFKGDAYRGSTMSVGSFDANAFGLYDMHGNVWEWVLDCYRDTLAGQPETGDAFYDADCSERVLRGGSYTNVPHLLRSANRVRIKPMDRDFNIGFRIARSLGKS